MSHHWHGTAHFTRMSTDAIAIARTPARDLTLISLVRFNAPRCPSFCLFYAHTDTRVYMCLYSDPCMYVRNSLTGVVIRRISYRVYIHRGVMLHRRTECRTLSLRHTGIGNASIYWSALRTLLLQILPARNELDRPICARYELVSRSIGDYTSFL